MIGSFSVAVSPMLVTVTVRTEFGDSSGIKVAELATGMGR
jgi:hypothetical protein